MKKKTASFDPSGVGVKNGRFIGLPFSEEDARIVLLPVPWDVTVSFADGTATAAQNILECSYQLDLYDTDAGDAWKTGIYMRPPDMLWLKKNKLLRKDAVAYIHFLESGGKPQSDPHFLKILKKINRTCEELNDWVYEETRAILKKGKKIGIVGGDHSVPLGYIKSLS
ncbi:MAG TPA: agmatinase, partial [Bacteroidetes bacterium]|nr:agmatinase [Bacteroidota bacterium]